MWPSSLLQQRWPWEAPPDQVATSAPGLGFLRRRCKKEEGVCVYSFSRTNHLKLVPPRFSWDIPQLIIVVREATRGFYFLPLSQSQVCGPTLTMSHCMTPR